MAPEKISEVLVYIAKGREHHRGMNSHTQTPTGRKAKATATEKDNALRKELTSRYKGYAAKTAEGILGIGETIEDGRSRFLDPDNYEAWIRDDLHMTPAKASEYALIYQCRYFEPGDDAWVHLHHDILVRLSRLEKDKFTKAMEYLASKDKPHHTEEDLNRYIREVLDGRPARAPYTRRSEVQSKTDQSTESGVSQETLKLWDELAQRFGKTTYAKLTPLDRLKVRNLAAKVAEKEAKPAPAALEKVPADQNLELESEPVPSAASPEATRPKAASPVIEGEPSEQDILSEDAPTTAEEDLGTLRMEEEFRVAYGEMKIKRLQAKLNAGIKELIGSLQQDDGTILLRLVVKPEIEVLPNPPD